MFWVCASGPGGVPGRALGHPRRTDLVFVLVALTLLAACGSDGLDTPEERIRALVGAIGDAVETRSTDAAVALLHDGYRDRWHAGPRAAARSLRGYLARHDEIHLFTIIRSIDVAPDGRRGEAVVYVAMTGVPVESVATLVSLNAELFRFDLGLVLADGEWRVKSADWQRVGIDALD